MQIAAATAESGASRYGRCVAHTSLPNMKSVPYGFEGPSVILVSRTICLPGMCLLPSKLDGAFACVFGFKSCTVDGRPRTLGVSDTKVFESSLTELEDMVGVEKETYGLLRVNISLSDLVFRKMQEQQSVFQAGG